MQVFDLSSVVLYSPPLYKIYFFEQSQEWHKDRDTI